MSYRLVIAARIQNVSIKGQRAVGELFAGIVRKIALTARLAEGFPLGRIQ